MKPLFDVCLITHNEAETLPRAIASLREFWTRGGIVNVCDTGSTDGTANLARSLGCNVKEVGEIYKRSITVEEAATIDNLFLESNEMSIVSPGGTYFSFAEARNDAVRMCKSDWVMSMDADEIVTSMNIDKINELIISELYTRFEYNFVFSHDHWGKEFVKFVQSKFYNNRHCQWEGTIHEMVCPITTLRPYLLTEDIYKLEHFQNPQTNRTGVLRGLAVDCLRNPTKHRNSHYFAREMWWNGRPWSAAKEFNRHIDLWGGSDYERMESMLYLGDIHGAMEQPKEQIEWVHKAAALQPLRREPIFRLAEIYKRRNQATQAKVYASAALTFQWDPSYGTNKEFWENEPHEIMYWACGWTGDLQGARTHILKCFEYQPYNPIYQRDTQYYFDYAATTVQGWMAFPEQLFLFNNAKNMESVIELGSWKGASTWALCKSGCPSITAIDHWKGSKEEAEAHAEASNGTVFEQFKKNMAGFDNLKYINGDINEVVDTIADRSVDMVFIDAGHSYEEVRNDIRKWKPKAKILLCGHDYGYAWPEVIQAVDEELGEIDGVAHTIWYKWMVKPRVSICVPSLGRPDKLRRLLNSIKEHADYDNYEVIVGADEPIPNNVGAPKMLTKLVAKSQGELVMFLGNDCVAKPGFLREAVWAMARNFPDLDGMVGLNDEYWPKGAVAPHWMASKKLLPHLDGEFFHTGYKHLGCDNELMFRVESIGKYAFADKAKIFHDHPMVTGWNNIDKYYENVYNGPNKEAEHNYYMERAKKYGFEKRF